MKVIISQPMNGKKESQIRLERQKVIKKLEDLGWQVTDTIFSDEAPKSCNPAIYYLSKSIEEISKVDADYEEYGENIIGDISYNAIKKLLSDFIYLKEENEKLREKN